VVDGVSCMPSGWDVLRDKRFRTFTEGGVGPGFVPRYCRRGLCLSAHAEPMTAASTTAVTAVRTMIQKKIRWASKRRAGSSSACCPNTRRRSADSVSSMRGESQDTRIRGFVQPPKRPWGPPVIAKIGFARLWSAGSAGSVGGLGGGGSGNDGAGGSGDGWIIGAGESDDRRRSLSFQWAGVSQAEANPPAGQSL
jgi:hypothetical protein